jgi:hypothetical protein
MTFLDTIRERLKDRPRILKEPLLKENLLKGEGMLGIMTSIRPRELTTEIKPQSGRTFSGQTDEAYCLECIEGHTMMAQTEMRHAIDRYRTAGEMTIGVTEKVRVAIREIEGIIEDARSTKGADIKIQKGLNEILEETRWVRKEFGVSGRGLTNGEGSMEDLTELRERIDALQEKAYNLAKDCPTCKKYNKVVGLLTERRH